MMVLRKAISLWNIGVSSYELKSSLMLELASVYRILTPFC